MELLSLILNFVLASGLVGVLLFYKPKRRKENAEANMSETQASVEEFNALKLQIEHLSGQLENSYDVIEKQQQIVDNTRVLLRDIQRKANDLEMRLIQEEHIRKRAEYDKCTIDCDYRMPSRP